MIGQSAGRAVPSPLAVLVGAGGAAALAAGFATHALSGAALVPANLFVLCAILAVGVDLWRMRAAEAADRIDLALFAVGLAMIASPMVSTTWAALGVFGAVCLRRLGVEARGAGWLLIALSVFFLKDRLWAGFVAGALLDLEAATLHAVAGPVIGSVERTGNLLLLADGRDLLILRDCSLLSLMGPSLLGVVALRRLLAPEVRTIGATLLITVAFVIVANVLRLAAMAYSAELYAIVHDGYGRTLFSMAMTAGVVLLGAWRRR